MCRSRGIMKQVIDRAMVTRWLSGYEAAWRAPGTDGLAGLFTSDATYLQSPYEQPVTGLDAIKRMWEEERESPDEVFTLASQRLTIARSITCFIMPRNRRPSQFCLAAEPSLSRRRLMVLMAESPSRASSALEDRRRWTPEGPVPDERALWRIFVHPADLA